MEKLSHPQDSSAATATSLEGLAQHSLVPTSCLKHSPGFLLPFGQGQSHYYHSHQALPTSSASPNSSLARCFL